MNEKISQLKQRIEQSEYNIFKLQQALDNEKMLLAMLKGALAALEELTNEQREVNQNTLRKDESQKNEPKHYEMEPNKTERVGGN